MPAYRKPHAVVLTGEGVFYSNEQRGDLRIGLGDALNLAEVMRGAEQLFMGGEGVVMWTRPLNRPHAPSRSRARPSGRSTSCGPGRPWPATNTTVSAPSTPSGWPAS